MKEYRRIRATALRKVCIENDYYECGDNDEYAYLLHDLSSKKFNLTTSDIAKIAQDIKNHSDTDDSITEIAFNVARATYSIFEEE